MSFLQVFQTKENFPLPYPLPESTDSMYERLTINDIPQQYRGSNMFDHLYPQVKADNVAYMSGLNIENWDKEYRSIYIMCCEFGIQNIVFVWSPTIVVNVLIQHFNWREFYPLPNQFIDHLIQNYNIGFCVRLIENSVRRTVESYLYPCPYQMYFNIESESRMIPNFNSTVIPAFDITRDKQIFAHGCNALNLCRFNETNYIKKALCHATANGMKGVVFHCGSSKDDPIPQALNTLCFNIVTGIRSANFSPDQVGTAKFILETPAGKGREVLTDFIDFVKFCNHLITNYPDIAPFFSICIDTCHVHQCGFAPHKYLELIHKIIPVSFVHFNDSNNGWCCRRDSHAKPGQGYIPWPFLLSVAEFCKKNSIPAVFEN